MHDKRRRWLVVLVGLWLDAGRTGWRPAGRFGLAAFVALGSPALLAYLAWRLERSAPER